MTTETPAADIVERLRETRKRGVFDAIAQGVYASADEAADEITSLRAENAELRVKAETYTQMHETAVDLGYPSILEALEDVDELQRKLNEAVKALKPFADEADGYDYGDGSGPDFKDYPDNSCLPEINDLLVGQVRKARETLTSIRGEA